MSRDIRTGDLVAIVGAIHLASALAFYRRPLTAMVRAGIVNSVRDHDDRDAASWFATTGLALLTLGITTRHFEKLAGHTPPGLAIGLAVIAAAVGATQPASGWPLMAATALHAHRRRNPHR